MAMKGVRALQDCIFCRIVAKEVASDIVYEDDEVVAFRDINPQAPVHVLVIPRKHIPTLNDATPEDQPLLGKLLLVAQQLAQKLQVADGGYRLVLNVNRGAGQSVFHIHLHLLGGRVFHWPPG
jgi:histidine triad (HIT) family protein